MRNFSRNPNLELRATLTDRREQIAFVVLRNAIPIIGILFLGWSAQNLIVLYFVDTLGAMWALVTGLALNFPEAKLATTWLARIQVFTTMLFVGAFLVAFMAIPLGMPLLIYSMATDWNWQAALQDQEFVYGIIGIAGLSFVGMIRQYQAIATLTPDESNAKRDFGILMTRWVIILVVIYSLGFLLGTYGAYLMVIAYVVASGYSEIFPEKFSNLLGKVGRSKERIPKEHTPKERRSKR